MPYFLGVITDEDMFNGIYTPTYALHKALKSNRSVPLRVKKGQIKRKQLLIFPTMTNNEQYVQYFSRIRTRNVLYEKDKRKANDLKNTITGWLCWFSCDRHGQATGHVLLIKHIPQKFDGYAYDQRTQRFIDTITRKRQCKNLLTHQIECIDAIDNFKKKQYPQ